MFVNLNDGTTKYECAPVRMAQEPLAPLIWPHPIAPRTSKEKGQ